MATRFLCFLLAMLCAPALAAERVFDFSTMPVDKPPPGFKSALAGQGKPGDWRVILEAVPTTAPGVTNTPGVTKHAVLAQLAQDRTDEHFPLLIYEGDVYGDFTLTTRFILVSGTAEEMAGLAFRLQDEKNFYVIRASGLGNNVRFYKVVNGERSAPIGPDIPIPKGVWQELTVTCQGNEIRCRLNGQPIMPALTDNSFTRGRIAFWTKSDAVTYFRDAKITYVPQVLPAAALVNDVMKEYPRLEGVKVFAREGEPPALKLIAANDPAQVGQPGGTNEQDVLANGTIYFGRDKGTVSVMMPLRDRNGDPVAAVKVTMKSFPGQTEQNALVRAKPIIQRMQNRVLNARDLFE